MHRYFWGIFFCIFFLQLQAADLHPPRFTGLHGAPRSEIKNLYYLAPSFLVYNPVIVEVGAYRGENTLELARRFPYGKVISFEPNPRKFDELMENVKDQPRVQVVPLALSNNRGAARLYLENSLLNFSEEPQENAAILKPLSRNRQPGRDLFVTVPCSTLDVWCKENGVDRIDFLQLDAGGSEYQILQGASRILQTVQVIHTKTYLCRYWNEGKLFHELSHLLKKMGFELLSHWYFEKLYGEATFVRKEIYDALYR